MDTSPPQFKRTRLTSDRIDTKMRDVLYFDTSYTPPQYPSQGSFAAALPHAPPPPASSHHQHSAAHVLNSLQQQPAPHLSALHGNGFSHHDSSAQEQQQEYRIPERGSEGGDEDEEGQQEQQETEHFAGLAQAVPSEAEGAPRATRTSGRARRPSRRSAQADGSVYLDAADDEEELGGLEQPHHFAQPAEEGYGDEYSAPSGGFEDAEAGSAGAVLGEAAAEDEHEPLYVNAKQYHRILKRRAARARLEEMGRLSRQRKVRSSSLLLCCLPTDALLSRLPSRSDSLLSAFLSGSPTFTSLDTSTPCDGHAVLEVGFSPSKSDRSWKREVRCRALRGTETLSASRRKRSTRDCRWRGRGACDELLSEVILRAVLPFTCCLTEARRTPREDSEGTLRSSFPDARLQSKPRLWPF